VSSPTTGSCSPTSRSSRSRLNDNIKELRDLLLGLRPPMLDDMGLYKALETHLKNFGLKNGVQYSFQQPESPPTLTRDAQINIFRIVQEALNNIEKHASATHVTIEIETSPQKLFLTIRDARRGFSTPRTRGRPRNLGIASHAGADRAAWRAPQDKV